MLKRKDVLSHMRKAKRLMLKKRPFTWVYYDKYWSTRNKTGNVLILHRGNFRSLEYLLQGNVRQMMGGTFMGAWESRDIVRKFLKIVKRGSKGNN